MKQKLQQHVEKFKGLEKGQKIKVAAVAILLIIIIWMLIGMFGSNNETVVSSTPAKSTTPVKKQQVTYHIAQQSKIAKPQSVTKTLNDKQKAYVNSVNELQMLQLQQQIAQTKQQIAAAELEAVTANKKIQDLTAPKKAVYQPEIEQPIEATPVVVTKPKSMFDSELKLVYMANESGKWQLIINDNGSLINATVGSVLPDGSKIIAVKGASIVVSLNGKTRTLNVTPAM